MMATLNKILIVDEDNPLRRELIETLCAQELQREISLYTSDTPQSALAIAKDQPLDLIIVARLTSQQETLDLVQDLRRLEESKDVPILLTSSFYSSPTFDDLSRSLPNTHYVIRPLQRGAFLQTIDHLLEPT